MKRTFYTLLLSTALLMPMVPMTAAAQTSDNEEEDIVVTDEEGNKEEIEVPEALTSELDSLMNEYMSRNYLDKDDDCRMKDVNPYYEKEVYVDRLSRMPTIIEMPYNEVVRKFIDRYSGRLRHSVSYMLGASNFYMPIFEQALDTYGLPLELKYLPKKDQQK